MAVSRFAHALICLVLVSSAHAFSNGGPNDACDSLMPSHDAEPQQSSPPYKITTPTTVGAGQIIEVTLSGSVIFTGYFIRARQNNAFIGGAFQQSNSGQLRCNNQGMTHSNSDSRNTVTMLWRAPDNIDASLPVHFIATVVQERSIFWISVLSPNIIVATSAGIPAPTSTISAAPTNPHFSTPTSTNFETPTNPNLNVQPSPNFNTAANPSITTPKSPTDEQIPPREPTNSIPGNGITNQEIGTTSRSQNADNPTTFGQPVTDTNFTTETVRNSTPAAGSLGQTGIADPNKGNNSFQNPGSVVVDPACGKSKGCFHNCQTGDFCTYVISWSYQKDTVHFTFLYKTLSTTDQWIALALSHDTLMGTDSVMECVMENGKIEVKTSYNNGKINEYTGDKYAGLSDMIGSMKNGVLACSFRRNVKYPKDTRVFDLGLSYHLMVATGEAVSGNKLAHSYEKLPKVSADKINLQQVYSVSHGLDPIYPMVKTHGTLMTLAWLFFASCGLLIARHGRTMFNNSKPFGIHVWFHIHRFCMVMTAFLTTLGFILILVESQGYSFVPEAPGKSYRTLHPPLGLILVVVTLVNPLMALFRPDVKAPSRLLFKWTHWGIGVCAWCTSFVLVAIGLDLSKSQADVEAIYVFFAFIGYQVCIDIITRVAPSLLASLYERCSKDCGSSKNSYDINMTEIPTNEVPAIERGNTAVSNKEVRTKENETFMQHKNVITSAILVLHVLVSASFATAVLYFFLRRPVGRASTAD